MKSINKIIKEEIFSFIVENTTPFREVKYFHPSGKSMPNGVHYQRGGFLNECRSNKDSFVLDEGVHGEQYGLKRFRGGIIVFAVDVNAVQLDKNWFKNKVKQIIATFNNRFNRDKKIHNTINVLNKGIEDEKEKVGAYSVGNLFKGKYVGDNGEMYNDRSLAVEINGLSSKHLLKLAELLATEFKQQTVLVKDLNLNKIYLADDIPMSPDTTLEDELSKLNVG